MRQRISITVMTALAAFGLTLSTAPAFADDNTNPNGSTATDKITLNLFNLTDVHGHISQVEKKGVIKEAGLAAMACYINKERASHPDSAFTLLGDNIGASPFTSGILYDNPTIEALNLIKPVASTIGNHELDLGQDVFRARLNGDKAKVRNEEVQFSKVEFPYLASNIKGLGNFADGTPYLRPYEIWEAPDSKIKVAFIGGIAKDVPYKLSPGTTAGLTFEDPIQTINDLAKELKESGKADVVIAMLDDDTKNNYPNMGKYVDGLMGGDTHVPYQFTQVKGAEDNTLSADASGSYTDNLANLKLTIDPTTKKVTSSEAILIPAAEVAKCGEDPQVKQIVSDAETKAEKEGEKVIASGYSAGTPFKRAVFTDDSNKAGENRGHESTLGDLAADALKAQIKTQDAQPQPVDIGIINAGGLRRDLNVNENGDITYAATFAVMPFSNELGYVTITGAKFKEALEQQWKTDLNTQNSRPMLKLGISSNVHYTYDATKPYGQRITSITIDGAPMNMEKKYTVGSVTFLLAGGDSFDALTSGGPFKTNGELDRDSFNDYLADKVHEPEKIKRSVGVAGLDKVTYNAEKTEASGTLSLRGLSFTEGPGITKNVTVKIGSFEATGSVNNDLHDAKANTEEAIITTDGAGRAEIPFNIKLADVCKAADSGKQIALPVSIKTDFGTVVEENAKLSVAISCPGNAPAYGVPSVNTSEAPLPATVSALATTGTTAKTVAIVAVLLVIAGAAIVGIGIWRRRS